jgi:sialic acid synthase SpsE
MDNISFKRPKTTNDPIKNPEILIGRELKFDVKANEAITLNLLV